MVSSALNTLRGMPQKQADIYNTYLPASTKVRRDNYLPGPARLAQLQRLVTTAQNGLQDLQDAANKAEMAIRSKADSLSAAGAASEIAAVARENILLGYQNNNNDVADVCRILVEQHDRAGFAALRSLLPYLNEQGSADTVATYESQLYTREEKAILAEVYELDGSMTALRMNFKALSDFFAAQLLPGAVAGMFNRVESVWPWYGASPQRRQDLGAMGVAWDQLSQDKILLVDDFATAER